MREVSAKEKKDGTKGGEEGREPRGKGQTERERPSTSLMELFQEELKSDYVPLLEVFVVSAGRSVYRLSLTTAENPASRSGPIPHRMTLSEIVEQKRPPRHVRTWDFVYRAQLEMLCAVMDASERLFIITTSIDELSRNKIFYAGEGMVELGTTPNGNLILFPSGEVRCVCGWEGKQYLTRPLTDQRDSFERDTPHFRRLYFSGTDADNLVRIWTGGEAFRMDGVTLSPDDTFYVWGEAVSGPISSYRSAISPYWASITVRSPLSLNLYRRTSVAAVAAPTPTLAAVAGPASAGDLGSAPGPAGAEPRSKVADTVLALSVMSEPTPEFAAIVASLRAELAAAETRAQRLQKENEALREQTEELQNSGPECIICNANRVSVALSPCGHVFCGTCVKEQSTCPMCREPVAQRNKIFFP